MSFKVNPGVSEITLRSPDWSDMIVLDNNDIRRFTRSGDAKVYADSAWAKFVTYRYKFSVIQKSVITTLKAYLIANAGLVITIKDHLNSTKTGFIITPINEIIAVRPDCTYSVSFDFMEVPT